MNRKNFLIIIVIILIAAAGAVWYFVRQANPEFVVAAADGRATLKIQERLLPKGVKAEDIRITKIDDEADNKAKTRPLAVYRLEPDGTIFTEPVELTVKLDNFAPGGRVPMIMSLSGNTLEPVESKFAIHASGGATLTGKLKHFSNIVITAGFISAEFPPNLGQHYVGESFEFPITLYKHESNSIIEPNGMVVECELLADPVFMQGLFRAPEWIVTPALIPNMPADNTTMTANKMTFTGKFTCIRSGNIPFQIEYDAILVARVEYLSSKDSYYRILFPQKDDVPQIIIAETLAECIDRPEGPTITPPGGKKEFDSSGEAPPTPPPSGYEQNSTPKIQDSTPKPPPDQNPLPPTPPPASSGNVLRYRFTCSVTATPAPEFSATEFRLKANTEIVYDSGPPMPRGVGNVGGKFCPGDDWVPQCVDPRTSLPISTALDFIQEYDMDKQSQAAIDAQATSWFNVMSDGHRSCN